MMIKNSDYKLSTILSNTIIQQLWCILDFPLQLFPPLLTTLRIWMVSGLLNLCVWGWILHYFQMNLSIPSLLPPPLLRYHSLFLMHLWRKDHFFMTVQARTLFHTLISWPILYFWWNVWHRRKLSVLGCSYSWSEIILLQWSLFCILELDLKIKQFHLNWMTVLLSLLIRVLEWGSWFVSAPLIGCISWQLMEVFRRAGTSSLTPLQHRLYRACLWFWLVPQPSLSCPAHFPRYF